jgi:hypothetical protein
VYLGFAQAVHLIDRHLSVSQDFRCMVYKAHKAVTSLMGTPYSRAGCTVHSNMGYIVSSRTANVMHSMQVQHSTEYNRQLCIRTACKTQHSSQAGSTHLQDPSCSVLSAALQQAMRSNTSVIIHPRRRSHLGTCCSLSKHAHCKPIPMMCSSYRACSTGMYRQRLGVA